jgi:hypothetical protein
VDGYVIYNQTKNKSEYYPPSEHSNIRTVVVTVMFTIAVIKCVNLARGGERRVQGFGGET